MSIHISFLTLVIRRSAIENSYRGGWAEFNEHYPGHRESGGLFGITTMSTAEANATDAHLARMGVDVKKDVIIVDMMVGLMTDPVEGISVQQVDTEERFPQYIAVADPTGSDLSFRIRADHEESRHD